MHNPANASPGDVCHVLNCAPERNQVQTALMQWDGEALETAAYAGGCVVALMRSHEEWLLHPQVRALAELPLIEVEKIGDADPRPGPIGDRPLAGLRVLDLSRVIAGPDLPAIPWLVIDTGRGKLSSFVDLKSEQGRAMRPCCR